MDDIINIENGLNTLVSEAQLRANKENAQKSTGPKDTNNTRFNAIKHGLLSQKVMRIIPEEERDVIEGLRNEITAEFNRELTIIDSIIVEKFLCAYWRFLKAHEMDVVNLEHGWKRGFQYNIDSQIFSPRSHISESDSQEEKDHVAIVLNDRDELNRRYRVSAEKEFNKAFEELKNRLKY